MPHRFGDVLEVSFPQIDKWRVNVLYHGVARRSRKGDAAKFRPFLQPCGDIDCVTKYVAVIVDNFTNMHAHAKLHLAFLRQRGITFRHNRLRRKRRLDCLHGRWKVK